MQQLAEYRCFGGTLQFVRHPGLSTGCDMQFSIFVPPQALKKPAPVLWWLSGLTCTEENFSAKGGAYRAAAEAGLIVVAPDTSPRGEHVPDDEGYDLGQGASFYLNASAEPWATHFQMYSYISDELPELVLGNYPVDAERQGIAGHSMGGHGALTIALKNPDRYRSVSAFAPIVAPSQCPWGQKAFSAYLGDDTASWSDYDATALMTAMTERGACSEILIDQGLDDQFLKEQLLPDKFVAACKQAGQKLRYREHAGYDHGYYFIASFIEDHVQHHARILSAVEAGK